MPNDHGLRKAEEAFLIVRSLGASRRHTFSWSQYRDAWDAVSPSRGYWSPTGSQYLPAAMRQDGFKCTVGNALRALLVHGDVAKVGRGMYQACRTHASRPLFLPPGKCRPGQVRDAPHQAIV